MSNNYGPKIVTDGLVLCLDAADRNSYPGSGSTWYDLSGNGNNGTFGPGAAAPTFSSGNGGSLVFDGSDDYLGGNLNYSPTTYPNFSVEAWVYGDSWIIDNSYRGVLNRSNGVNHDFSVYISSSSHDTNSAGEMASWVINTSNSLIQHRSTNLILQTGTWNYCVWIFNDGTGFTYYLNDNNSATNNTNTTRRKTVTSSPYNVGKWVGGGYTWDGRISNVKFYTKALSADEVRGNYNATKGRFGL